MDQFKKYLQENRSELDSDIPQPMVWDRIEHELPAPAKTVSIMRMIAWSAAACVFVLAGVGVYSLLNDKGTNKLRDTSYESREVANNKLRDTTLRQAQGNNGLREITASIKPETRNPHPATPISQPASRIPNPESRNPQPASRITDLEANFTQVINLQKARISTMPMYAESAAYFSDFKVQLKQMDKDEAQIKMDISRKGMNDELLDQLINLYQQKLNILKQLQLEMNKTNNRYKQNRGAVDTVRTYFLSI